MAPGRLHISISGSDLTSSKRREEEWEPGWILEAGELCSSRNLSSVTVIRSAGLIHTKNNFNLRKNTDRELKFENINPVVVSEEKKFIV